MFFGIFDTVKHKILIILAIVLALAGTVFYFAGDRITYVLNYGWGKSQDERNLEIYGQMEKEYIAAMTADTYGGKTPKETLDMFVDALKKGDIELAAKYVKPDDDLSRDKTIATLQGIKEKGFLEQMAYDLSRDIRRDPCGEISENDFVFAAYNEDGDVGATIDMWFNKYSGVWKIENL